MSAEGSQSLLNRRDFLARAAKSGAAIGAAAGLSFWRHDPHGPGASNHADSISLPDFSIPGVGRRLSIVTGSDRVRTVGRALAALGGIGQFVKRGDRVLLKVNAAFASPPSLGATTHPALAGEVARLCFAAGAASVTVTDNPINDPVSCFRLSGLEQAVGAAGARLVLPSDSQFRPVTVAGARLLKDWPVLAGPFPGVAKVIGLAPLKDHHRSGASMTMKNWYGLLGGPRNIFHQDVHTLILELAMMVRPTLVILDGTTTMMTNGPTGGSLDDLKATNTMIASTDQVAADAFGATLLGKSPAALPFIIRAAEAGLGTADFESLHPLREGII